MPLITRNTLPPGGFVYTQNDNNGKKLKEFRSMSPFNEIAKEVFDMRVGNKLNRATLDEVKDDIDNAQCERLGFDPNHCAVKKKAFQFQPVRIFKASTSHLRQVAGDAVQAVGKLSHGAIILHRWLGEGMAPVSSELSQSRADTCSGRISGTPCAFNKPGWKPVEAAAEYFREISEAKTGLKLKVEGEENLHTCKLCFCDLKTKPFVPMKTILAGTPEAMLANIKEKKADCWIVVEAEQLKVVA